MKKLSLLLVTTLVGVLVSIVGFIAPATANQSCLDENEWDRIEDGLLRSVVHDIIDNDGFVTMQVHDSQTNDYRYTWRGYYRCTPGSGISQIGYRDYKGGDVVWRVFGKAR